MSTNGCKANKKKEMKKLIIIILITLATPRLWAQQLALGTNVLMDALMMPNVNAELSLGRSHFLERTVLGGQVYFMRKPWGTNVKAWGVQPEIKYFFSGRAFSEWFVGIGAHLSQYDITWSGKVYDGNSIGAGIIFGYVFNITDRLNIDVHTGYGLTKYRQKEYYEGDQYDVEFATKSHVATPNSRGYVLMPTQLGVSLTYIFK